MVVLRMLGVASPPVAVERMLSTVSELVVVVKRDYFYARTSDSFVRVTVPVDVIDIGLGSESVFVLVAVT